MRTIAICQARMGSTRLPGKVLAYIGGKAVLQWTVDAVRKADGIDEVVVATSGLPADDAIARYCALNRINCFRGSEADVLDRFYQCSIAYAADVILRLTCDCPFLDHRVITEVVRLRALKETDYASNIDPPTYPDGLDVECFTFSALSAAWREAVRPSDRDCVPQFIVRNRHRFAAVNLTCPLPGLVKERWVLDTEDDFKFCLHLAMHLKQDTPPSYLDILRVLDIVPEIRDHNKSGIRNERFYEAIHSEELPPRLFDTSNRLLGRALERIPFGAQTFSKSHLQFPPGRAPLYVSHADGARIFDVDGNDYVDLVNAILPVVLGYRDPDVDEAVRRQLDNGISFSLATELELELAEILCNHIPCAEMVKFGKSGTDVTTAAIRVARAFTGRADIAFTGYHGWGDWSLAATERNHGIPYTTKLHTHNVPYGNLDAIRDLLVQKELAAVIVEPDEDPSYLKWLRDMCDKFGTVLIFDEVITGFRWMMGGAQKFHNVTPDLACFGKAMANGMPLSAVVGKRHIMKKFEPPDNIFYSGTMFGETLSLAASIATIKKMEREHVIQHLWDVGAQIVTKVNGFLDYHGLNDVIQFTGMHPRMKINFADHEHGTANQIKTLFMQTMAENGVLMINSHNVSFAIKEPEIKRITAAYNETLVTISDVLEHPGAIGQVIDTEAYPFDPLRKT